MGVYLVRIYPRSSMSNTQSLEKTKKERAELLRLKAGLLEVIPAICSKCNKSIELGYVERQVESFGKEQLEAMMKSTEKIGLFCCNCLNEKNQRRGANEVAAFTDWYNCNFLTSGTIGPIVINTSTITPTRSTPQTDVWTARDVQITWNGQQMSNISECDITAHRNIDPYILREYSNNREEIRARIRLGAQENQIPHINDNIQIQIGNTNLGTFQILRTDMPIRAEEIIYLQLDARKIEETT